MRAFSLDADLLQIVWVPPASHLHLRAQLSGYPHDGTASCGQVALPDADPAWNQGAIGMPAISAGAGCSKLPPQKHVLQGQKTCEVHILKIFSMLPVPQKH